MSGVEWIPVGSVLPRAFSDQVLVNGSIYTAIDKGTLSSASRFKGTFNGNGYSIKNLTINVNTSNLQKYAVFNYTVNDNVCGINSMYLYVGFFGLADGATISNVNFENSSVTIDASLTNGTAQITSTDENYPGKNTVLNVVNTITNPTGTVQTLIDVGTVVGTVYNSSLTKIALTSSNVTAGVGHNVASGIGTIAGYAKYSRMAEVSITNSALTANSGCTIAGGVVGMVAHYSEIEGGKNFFENVSAEKQSIISDLKINGLTIVGDEYYNSATAGVAGIGAGLVFKNSTVEGLNITIHKNANDADTISTNVAGAVCSLHDVITKDGSKFSALIENVSIIGANIKSEDQRLVASDAAGFVATNQGEIKNVKFTGSLAGLNVGGLVLDNEGKITFTDEFVGYAVDCTINTKVAAAPIACYNYNGTIEGATAKTKVKSKIESYVQTAAEVIAQVRPLSEYVVAGAVAFNMGGSVSNFDVEVISNNAINFGGAVGYIGGTQEDSPVSRGYSFANDNSFSKGQPLSFYGKTSVVEAIVVNSKVNTRVYGLGIDTIYVGGAAAIVYSDSRLANVVSNISVNNYETASTETLTAGMAAGLVAVVQGNNIAIDEVKLGDIYIFVNYSTQEKTVGEGESAQKQKISYVAGAFCSVAGGNIAISNISRSSESVVKLTNMHKALGAEIIHAATGAYGFIATAKGTDSSNKITLSNIELRNMDINAYYVACETMNAYSNTDGVNTIITENIETHSSTN